MCRLPLSLSLGHLMSQGGERNERARGGVRERGPTLLSEILLSIFLTAEMLARNRIAPN